VKTIQPITNFVIYLYHHLFCKCFVRKITFYFNIWIVWNLCICILHYIPVCNDNENTLHLDIFILWPCSCQCQCNSYGAVIRRRRRYRLLQRNRVAMVIIKFIHMVKQVSFKQTAYCWRDVAILAIQLMQSFEMQCEYYEQQLQFCRRNCYYIAHRSKIVYISDRRRWWWWLARINTVVAAAVAHVT